MRTTKIILEDKAVSMDAEAKKLMIRKYLIRLIKQKQRNDAPKA